MAHSKQTHATVPVAIKAAAAKPKSGSTSANMDRTKPSERKRSFEVSFVWLLNAAAIMASRAGNKIKTPFDTPMAVAMSGQWKKYEQRRPALTHHKRKQGN